MESGEGAGGGCSSTGAALGERERRDSREERGAAWQHFLFILGTFFLTGSVWSG